MQHEADQRATGEDASGILPISDSDIARLRAETPSSEDFLHFDNAGASPLPQPVYHAINDHLQLEAKLGGYAAKRAVEPAVEALYQSLARLINAKPEEIAFAESATRAWDLAFYGIPLLPGDRILLGRTEYSSNYLAMLQRARACGAELVIIPDAANGTIDLAALAAELDERVRVVSICHVPTSNGLINDVEAVGQLLKDHPALYLLDACQSVGQINLDVDRIGCDVLTATGRKFLRGPRGTGFLYIRKNVLNRFEPPFVDIRSARWTERDTFEWREDMLRFESWESAIALRLGLGTAVDYALSIGINRIETRVVALAHELRAGLAKDDRIALLDRGDSRCGIVTFSIPGNACDYCAQLRQKGLMCGSVERSDARLDLEWGQPHSVVRLSPHYFNTFEECRRAAALVIEELDRCG